LTQHKKFLLKKVMNKFDIIEVNLNPQKGHAQAGIRPAIIIQSNAFNQYSPTLIIVPLTSKQKKIFPGEFQITPSIENGLTKTSRFLGSQIMTLDKSFIAKKIGTLEPVYWEKLEESIMIVLDLKNQF